MTPQIYYERDWTGSGLRHKIFVGGVLVWLHVPFADGPLPTDVEGLLRLLPAHVFPGDFEEPERFQSWRRAPVALVPTKNTQ